MLGLAEQERARALGDELRLLVDDEVAAAGHELEPALVRMRLKPRKQMPGDEDIVLAEEDQGWDSQPL